MLVKLLIEGLCRRGAVRENNEDFIEYGTHPEASFFWGVIADGMGGHQAGEVASEMLAKSVKQAVERLENYNQNWEVWVTQVLQEANQCIFSASKNSAELQGMGTTGVVLVGHKNQYYVGWVGDSRAYLWRKDTLEQLTCDHTAIQYLLDKGAISQMEASRSNTRHILARALGIKNTVEVDSIKGKLKTGDIFMLSTDGLHEVLSSEVISRQIAPFANKQSVCDKLYHQAIELGSRDNISLILIKLDFD